MSVDAVRNRVSKRKLNSSDVKHRTADISIIAKNLAAKKTEEMMVSALKQNENAPLSIVAASIAKPTKSELFSPKLTNSSFPKDHPFNRDGYKYVLAEADSNAPHRKEFDESTSLAGKPIPGFLCRVLTFPSVLLSFQDRAQQMSISDDRSTVTGYKFYCTIRANVSVSLPPFSPSFYDEKKKNLAKVTEEENIQRIDEEGGGDDKSSKESNANDMDKPKTKNGSSCLTETYKCGTCAWYFETKIVQMIEGAATRIGWAQSYANLQAPLGFDKFGYSYRSRYGTRFHESIGKHFDDGGGYKEGDYIGCLIQFRPSDQTTDFKPSLPPTLKDKPLVKFKSHFYYEIKDKTQTAVKEIQTLPGSSISFFKNGELVGCAFKDINAGEYYPAISSFKNAKVSFNPGPNFRYPPPSHTPDGDDIPIKPISNRPDQVEVEQSTADMLFFVGHERKLSLDSYDMSP